MVRSERDLVLLLYALCPNGDYIIKRSKKLNMLVVLFYMYTDPPLQSSQQKLPAMVPANTAV